VSVDFSSFERAEAAVAAATSAAIAEIRERDRLDHPDLKAAAFAYLERGGKRGRPLLCHLACGAAGGEGARLGSAPVAIEVFHAWTLIHDDLIDNDDRRRGGPTVHAEYRDRMRRDGASAPRAEDYGRAVAVLAGDYLHGLAVRLVLRPAAEGRVPIEVVGSAARWMETDLVRDLVEGEMWDVAFTHRPIGAVAHEEILEMYRRKTASLIGYAARVGAMVGLATPEGDSGPPAELAAFGELCGIAFQLQDDVLGIVGDEQRLGKPVGSDIREGKRTTILLEAYREADPDERALLDRVAGDRRARPEDVSRVRSILERRGGLEHARRQADEYVRRALERLDAIPPSPFRDLLAEWAGRAVRRDR
jgi:geranylgeranyl diphosphate synthase type I